MPDRFSDRSPDQPSDDELRDHATFAAGRNPSGIGVAVAHSGYASGEHFWGCIVSNGEEWHFIRVLGVDLGPTALLPPELIEQGVEAFAATLPESDRLYALLNANPLHVERSGRCATEPLPRGQRTTARLESARSLRMSSRSTCVITGRTMRSAVRRSRRCRRIPTFPTSTSTSASTRAGSLKGVVRHQSDSNAAFETATRIPGVGGITNKIEVVTAGG